MTPQTFTCFACETIFDFTEFKKIPPSTMDSLVQFDVLKIITCPHCHFSFADQKVNDDDLEYFYSEAYSGIAKKVGKNVKKINLNDNWFNTRYLSQIELIQKFYDLKSNSKILEIGSGIGDLFKTLKYLGYNSDNYAIEPSLDAHPSLEMLDVSVLKMSLNSKSISELPKNKFDIIVMSHSLEHFNAKDIPAILIGIYNSLTEGGCFLCEVPNANLVRYPEANDLVNPHLTFFSVESIKLLFLKTGFDIAFLNACGDNQFSKKPPNDEYLKMLKDKKYFDYKVSDNGKVKINIGYHNWLLEKTKKNKRRVYIRNIVIKLLRITKILSVVKKLKTPGVYDILRDTNFMYSEDREFIRVVAKK